jgi:CheY-like chemotaxis protein
MKNIKHIVLIDDNKIDCFVNQKMVSIANKNTITQIFNSSVKALEYFNTKPKNPESCPLFITDLIFLDINIPVMNGFEFLNELSKMKEFKKRPIDVYFLSSSNNEEDITDALKFKFCSGYIIKPLTKEKIITLLDSKKETGIELKQNINF